jgi:N-methylhydantoinase B
MDTIAKRKASIDPITLEIQWKRLITILNETDTTLVRTSFSTIVGEGRDFACIMVDEHGHALAQSTFSSTLFTIMLPRTTRHLLDFFPPETLTEGDILLTNDPWMGAGHLPDLIFVRPVFHSDKPVAYIATAAHVADIGGRLGYFESRDLYEEGLQIPPCKVYKAGEPNEEVLSFIRQNVRVPDQVIGDVRAIVAAENVGAIRLQEFMDDYDLQDLRRLASEIHSRSEAAMREVIRSLPEGEWHYEVMTDGYVEPVKIHARVKIAGGELVVDFEGTSPQTHQGAINCALNATLGDTLVALKSSLAPDIPNNEGLFKPITIKVPEGSILNCDHGLPVRGRSVTAVHTHEAVYGALATVAPDRVQAGTGTFWGIIANCRLPNGRRANAYLIPRGGKGAVYDRDGIACIAFPTNGTLASTEVFETRVPLRLEAKDLVLDSGGPGKFRGGQGQRLELVSYSDTPVTVTIRPNNVRYPPPGLLGGKDAPLGFWELNGEKVEGNTRLLDLMKGDRLTLNIPGGGGDYPPEERDVEMVRRDVIEGRVSFARARIDYGVVLDPETFEVLKAETIALRKRVHDEE